MVVNSKPKTGESLVVRVTALGCGYGPPHPPAAQAWALNFESIQAHTMRNEEGLSLIKLIYGYEKEVEEEIDARIAVVLVALARAGPKRCSCCWV